MLLFVLNVGINSLYNIGGNIDTLKLLTYTLYIRKRSFVNIDITCKTNMASRQLEEELSEAVRKFTCLYDKSKKDIMTKT